MLLWTCIFLVVALFSASDACSCYQRRGESYADFLCRNSFVARAIIKPAPDASSESGESPADLLWSSRSEKFHEIEIISVFRNAKDTTPIPSIIRTPANGAMCGVKFQVYEEYLILGEVKGDEILTSMCSSNIRWSELSKRDIDGLESGKFARGCSQIALRRDLHRAHRRLHLMSSRQLKPV